MCVCRVGETLPITVSAACGPGGDDSIYSCSESLKDDVLFASEGLIAYPSWKSQAAAVFTCQSLPGHSLI